MKTLLAILFLSLASVAFAQTSINSQGGTVVENSDETLGVALSPVTLDNGSPADGYISLSTGPIQSGNPKQRGFAATSYNAGGSFVISVVGQGTIFNGTIASALWKQPARGVDTYELLGSIVSIDGTQTGNFTLTTVNPITFVGSASVASIAVTLNPAANAKR